MNSPPLSRTVFALLLIACLSACTSAGSLGQTRYFPQDRQEIWAAAINAVNLMGARVIESNQSMGFITGSINVDSFGGGVNLNISIRFDSMGGDVQVSATEAGATEDSDLRREELKFFEDQYLDIVEQVLQSARGRRSAYPR